MDFAADRIYWFSALLNISRKGLTKHLLFGTLLWYFAWPLVWSQMTWEKSGIFCGDRKNATSLPKAFWDILLSV